MPMQSTMTLIQLCLSSGTPTAKHSPNCSTHRHI